MNYESIVPSRELCQKIATLGICQDGAELWYSGDGKYVDHYVVDEKESITSLIAPTLPRMMAELKKYSFELWFLENGEFEIAFTAKDTHPCEFVQDIDINNAVAKALIAIKEQSHAD